MARLELVVTVQLRELVDGDRKAPTITNISEWKHMFTEAELTQTVLPMKERVSTGVRSAFDAGDVERKFSDAVKSWAELRELETERARIDAAIAAKRGFVRTR